MKKLLALAITGIMVLGLTACGGGGADVVPIPDDDYSATGTMDLYDLVEGSWVAQTQMATIGYDFYDDATYFFWSDGGRQETGTYSFDGKEVWATSEDDELTILSYTGDSLVTEDGAVFYRESDDDDLESGPASEGGYGTSGRAMNEFIGYWEGRENPPTIWYLFTHDAVFYCNRDKGYLEKGTFVVNDAGYAQLTYDSGETEELMNFDTDYILYDSVDGLSRLSTDDTVEQWILDQFAVSEPVYNDDATNELNAELAGIYEGESGPFTYTYIFYENGTYEWSSDGGNEGYGSYYFDGETILTTPNGGGEIDEYTYDIVSIYDEYGNEFEYIGDPD